MKYGAPTGGGILGGVAGVVAVGSIAGWWLPVVAGVAAGVGAARVAHNMGRRAQSHDHHRNYRRVGHRGRLVHRS